MKLNNKTKEILIVGIVLLIQTIIFVVAGVNKSYIHMDEAYSLGLASYNKLEIQQNEDFYDTWHNKEYYEDYLTVNENEKDSFAQVYENQKNDVHPPLYYLLLRIAMGFNLNSFSKWPGIILNIIIYLFITIFMYLIIKKILNERFKISIFILIAGIITLSTINNAIYIRMYAFSTLNIAITTYLHLKLLDKNSNNGKLLLAIGIMALVGSLTHYYYLFYLAGIFVMLVIKYIKEKNYKELGKYVGTMILAGLASLIIFPYSIQHMFFGYRGQGAISNLLNISEFLKRIGQYFLTINIYAFNNILFLLLILILGIIIYKRIKKIQLLEEKNKYIKYIIFPTGLYVILVALSAPWIELRYVMPVCNLLLVIILYYIVMLFKNVIKEKTLNKVMIGIIVLLIIMPGVSNKVIDLAVGTKFREEEENSYSSKQEIVENLKNELNIPIDIFYNLSDSPIDNTLLFVKNFKIEPEVLFSNKSNITETIKNELNNVPALYIFNSSNNRFLDDILLFATINESYIAKDIECSEEKIGEIIFNKDISNGMIVFINDGQENEIILDNIKKATGLTETIYLQRLNACDVYYLNYQI